MVSLRKLSVADLRREIQRRAKGGDRLVTQRAKLAKKLAVIDAELADLGIDAPKRRGRPPGRKPGRRGPGRPKGSKNQRRAKRAKNSMSLLEAIVSGVRLGSTVSPAEAAGAAKQAGYKSSSPNLGMMVANQLAKATQFKRVGRGQYLLKSSGTPPARHLRRPSPKPGPPKHGKHGRMPAAAVSPKKAAVA